ncbi:7TM-DISM domain-containing protein [Polaribacter sp. IC073]|uniref:7TM-DISM domain-containing protein n=1 Tax=Polaribacter sp. IC073 TaxID=2508540 RepID=UPI001CB995C2
MGFYNGCAFIIILINIFYFINFKDDLFIYYSLFLLSMTSSLFVSDGMLFFFNLSKPVINNSYVIVHFFVYFFSFLFSKNYLQINQYFSKASNYGWLLLMLVFTFLCIYLVTDIFIFFVIMEIFGFSLLLLLLLLFCWFLSVLLFRKNFYTKFFVIGYFFILILSINFFILKLFGFSFFYISPTTLKLGGFFEMILLSFAVIYRMGILNNENLLMRNEIVNYSKEIKAFQKLLKNQVRQKRTF